MMDSETPSEWRDLVVKSGNLICRPSFQMLGKKTSSRVIFRPPREKKAELRAEITILHFF
jgi:hypothetical protein